MMIQIVFSHYFILIVSWYLDDIFLCCYHAYKNVYVLLGHFNGILSKKGDKFVDAIHHLDTRRALRVLCFQVALSSVTGIADKPTCKILSWWKNCSFVPSESYLCISEIQSLFHLSFSIKQNFILIDQGEILA